MHEADAPPALQADAAVEVRRLFDGARGCDTFDQRILSFHDRSQERLDTEADEVLYVLAGEGEATIEGFEHRLAPGTAAFVARGTPWSVDDVGADDPLTVLSVLVREPHDAGAGHSVLQLSEDATHGATAGRQFSLGVTPEVGCVSVTQFVGFIPVGRAPDHYHRYDEVVYVLEATVSCTQPARERCSKPVAACTCRRGSCTASRTRARRSCGCSASSGRRD